MEDKLFGRDLFGEVIKQQVDGRLRERFIMPPFSVLNAREGAWQERKAMWLSLGIKSELGRGEGILMSAEQVTSPGLNFYRDKEKASPGGSARPACDYSKRERGDGHGRPLARTEGSGGPGELSKAFKSQSRQTALQKTGNSKGLLHSGPTIDTNNGEQWEGGCSARQNNGTSIFDPVLTELCYTWFCPAGGQIIDPFAGGSVRGIVAGFMGYKYHGIELAEAQIAANQAQKAEIVPDSEVTWLNGDSAELLPSAPMSDFIIACPPYGDLERYSDDPRDLSTMGYADFYGALKRIVELCEARLKPNRFACFVIGDFRDKKTGNYRGFVADTVNIFRDCGMPLYNDAVLLTAVGSLPVRVSGQFEGSRKLGKTHQNVLVFQKGDARKAFSNGK